MSPRLSQTHAVWVSLIDVADGRMAICVFHRAGQVGGSNQRWRPISAFVLPQGRSRRPARSVRVAASFGGGTVLADSVRLEPRAASPSPPGSSTSQTVAPTASLPAMSTTRKASTWSKRTHLANPESCGTGSRCPRRPRLARLPATIRAPTPGPGSRPRPGFLCPQVSPPCRRGTPPCRRESPSLPPAQHRQARMRGPILTRPPAWHQAR